MSMQRYIQVNVIAVRKHNNGVHAKSKVYLVTIFMPQVKAPLWLLYITQSVMVSCVTVSLFSMVSGKHF